MRWAASQPAEPVTTRFVWEGFRLLQEVHGDEPLTYVYSDQDSYDPLARIDGVDAPEISVPLSVATALWSG